MRAIRARAVRVALSIAAFLPVWLLAVTSAWAQTTTLGAAAPGSASDPQMIDLPTALRLAGSNNIDLAIVREAQTQAKAANDAATLAFFPWLTAGAGYARHTGAGQDFAGDVLDVDKELYGRSISINAQLNLGDAIFRKLAARQQLSAAGYSAEAKRSDTLLAAASAYIDLVNAAGAEDIAREAVRISRSYEQQLDRAVTIGLSNKSDALRVSVQAQRYEVVLRQASAAVRAAGANLATVLRLDPSLYLLPTERMVAPLELVPLDVASDKLIHDALTSRPEIRSSAAAVEAADQLRSAARFGPLVPSLGVQVIYGQVRGGSNGFLGETLNSHDYIYGLSWRLGPGGLFDFSRTELADSQLRLQRLSDEKLRDIISQQVVNAYEAAHAGFDQIALARRSVEIAEQSLNLSEQRKEFGVAAVLEVIQAQNDLTQARTDYAQALAQYAKAQYTLAHAMARIGQ